MEAIKQKALPAIVLVLTFALAACAGGRLPFDVDSIEQAWIETMSNGSIFSVSDTERADILDSLQNAKIEDITNKADAPTPTHLLVLRTNETDPTEYYTLTITDGVVNSLLFTKSRRSNVYRVSSEDLNVIVSSILSKQTAD